MRKFLLILLLLCLLSCREKGSHSSAPPPPDWAYPPKEPWTITTPAGIKIVADQSTINLYKERWELEGFVWDKIDWEALDEEFLYQKEYYCTTLNWDCKNSQPSDLTVYIKSHASLSVCTDKETPTQPYEIYVYINGSYQCIDGWYQPSTQTVYFHLGDDPGQDHTLILSEEPPSSQEFRAFQESAYPHELMHFFQDMAGRPMVDNDPAAGTLGTSISGYQIILPEEEVEEEEE